MAAFCHYLFFLWLASSASTVLAGEDNTGHRTLLIEPTVTQLQNYAALGDSYAAGVGAGFEVDNGCWQFADSYPGLLNRSNLLPEAHTFQFLACSGVRMLDMDTYTNRAERKLHRSVAEYIDKVENASVATLSIGGNDVGFFNLLNACVYNFYGPFSGSCENMLDFASAVVHSSQFAEGYNAMLDLLLERRDLPSFRVLATGYSAFFDDSLTEDCNNYTLSYWPGWWHQSLTVELRKRMNKICEDLNAKIGQIIEARSDDRVIWVNWAPRFDKHRFCQPGKPPVNGDDTWFFDVEFRSWVPDEVVDIETCEHESSLSGDWGERALCGVAIVKAKFPYATTQGVNDSVSAKGGREPFAPSTARLFHPTLQGHQAILEEIRRVWPYD
ncbi:hypothetical protein MGYG_05689 [Nannizzia gypsea CBS 118893]|uniref:SGNH hydrolase-type esterase domain-containing protein n=1 Tax=Arthroderma gypseum (strain ATCC MYA-4604 / CBS 118893) TaxID=535722 RepID=E4UXA4_ARTGP|nr:hypothetical protein MGYG_05689 [Nannizzia gypsea CBS 118893]EFR02691.1 hypothetical protein MGYG_05689 [Nannizzia gypsea CBS 118893]